ncbi:hypothetical protein [Chryseobacterium daeguense]|uniref:hypothetical protein n=1 Tax=Chryseobacterium daeguense TaxID=412438 RepID=UPI00040AF315|nr:hypothetical protein [Chryseobacterium daeguense]
MKNFFNIIAITGAAVLLTTACKHQAKDEIALTQQENPAQSTDKIEKNVYTDEFGDQLEVAVNETKNTVAVRFGGKSYELKKSDDLPEYTAGDADYQYSNIRGEITFLKKDYNMVLFHHKEKPASSNTKMASY